jgi:cytoskeletal protein RodZ
MGDFGGKLRQARERRGISLRQIAASTKISVGVLEALERNDVSKLPGGIFSRAFVRSYASEVGLDPDETVREFLAEFSGESTGAAPAHPSHPSPLSHPSHHLTPAEIIPDESQFESQRRIGIAALNLTVISLAVAGVILYLTMGRREAPAPAPGIEAAGGPSSAPSMPSPAVPSAPAPPPAEPKPHEGAPAPASPATASPADVQAGLTIELRPIGPCWASLTVDGEPAFSRMLQAGEREVRRFRDEIVLTVGDGAACEFALNGRPARPLAGGGEARKARITRQNLASFLQ